MEKVIKLSTRKDIVVYLIYVKMISILHNLNLREKQQQVLAYLLLYNQRYKHLPTGERNRMLFSTESRKQIVIDSNINKGSFDNIMSELTKMEGTEGLIVIDGKLNEKYIMYHEENNNINIQIMLK